MLNHGFSFRVWKVSDASSSTRWRSLSFRGNSFTHGETRNARNHSFSKLWFKLLAMDGLYSGRETRTVEDGGEGEGGGRSQSYNTRRFFKGEKKKSLICSNTTRIPAYNRNTQYTTQSKPPRRSAPHPHLPSCRLKRISSILINVGKPPDDCNRSWWRVIHWSRHILRVPKSSVKCP